MQELANVGRLCALAIVPDETIVLLTKLAFGDVASASGVDESDVVVGRRSYHTTTVERYDSAGELAWQHEREWTERRIARHHVAVASRIISLVSFVESGTPEEE